MGSSRSRRVAGLALITAVAGSGCLIALADTPADKAPPAVETPAAEKQAAEKQATEKPAAEKHAADTSAASPSVASTAPAAAPTTAPATQPSPPTHLVKPGKLSFTVTAEGIFTATEPYELRLKTLRHQGELKIVSAAANRAAVKAGDVLLELDPFAINNEVASADNDLMSARANLAKAEADADLGAKGDALAMRIQEQETSNAEAAVRWWEKVDGPHMLAQTELQVKVSKANVEDQDDELEQLRKMYRAEELTTATADIVVKRALRQLEISKLLSKMSEERAEKSETHSYPVARQSVIDTLEQSRQRLSMLKATQAQAAVLRKTALTAARLAATQAEKRLADVKQDQELFTIKAPSDGVVLYGHSSGGAWTGGDPKSMRVGEKLSAGQTVMTLFAPGDVKVELTLPESQTAWVADGAAAEVKPVAFPELNYAGKCAAPSPRGGAAGLGFVTTVDLPGVDPRIIPGMKANVRITGADVDGVLLAPNGAVANGKVWVRGKDGKEVEREVTTGRSDGKMLEVRKGLTDGEEILREAKK
jgi:multidrug resistance efflux pump